MFLSDLMSIFQWWAVIFLIGTIFLPLTNIIFSNFFDRGYIFAKIIGIASISYAIYIFGVLKIAPFETKSFFLIIMAFLFINYFISKKIKSYNFKLKPLLPIFIFEEVLFILPLLFWSFIHAHQPSIQGLEKYMDYGFINSIARSTSFPPQDMWFSPFYINYYYFGHL